MALESGNRDHWSRPRQKTEQRQLQIMRLSRNQLETFPMGIPENLFEFSLAYNSIGAIATKSVQSLRQLESLDLNNNQLTDSSFQVKFNKTYRNSLL